MKDRILITVKLPQKVKEVVEKLAKKHLRSITKEIEFLIIEAGKNENL